jgi:hypothetical protein
MLAIHLAVILRKIRDGDITNIPSPGDIVPTRVIFGFVAVVALLGLWAALL